MINKKRESDIKKIEKIVKKNALEHHMKLIKWLYDNHRKILREYEKTLGGLRIHFVGGNENE